MINITRINNSAKQSENPKIYFNNLDALRFFACLMVLICHTELDVVLSSVFHNDFITRLLRTVGSGELGVSFFFVLSGFLITYLILYEEKVSGSFNLKGFYIRRILRIWPLYFFVILFGFFAYPFMKHLLDISSDIPNKLIYYLTFLGNFDHVFNYALLYAKSPLMIDNSWSISIEEQFYLIWPLLFFIFQKRFYKYIFVTVILLSLLYRVSQANNWYALYFHSLSVCSDLAVGGLAAYLALYSSRFIKLITGMKKWIVVGIYITGFVLLLYFDYIFPVYFNTVFLRLLLGLFFVFIIIEQNYCDNSFFKLHKLSKISGFGKYTYGMYLLHPIAIQLVVIVFKVFKVTHDLNIFLNIVYIVLSFIFTFLFSYFSYHYFEYFFLNLKKRFATIKIE